MVWLIAQGFNGEISGLLVFVLVIILIPVALVVNIFTLVLVRGSSMIKQLRSVQKQASQKATSSHRGGRVRVENLAEKEGRKS